MILPALSSRLSRNSGSPETTCVAVIEVATQVEIQKQYVVSSFRPDAGEVIRDFYFIIPNLLKINACLNASSLR